MTVVCFRARDESPEQFEMMRAWCSTVETIPWSESRKFGAVFYAELACRLAAPLPYTVWKYRSAAMTARLRALLDSGKYDLLLCDFLHPSINCLDLSFTPKVLFQHNVEAAIRTRQVEHETNPVARAFLALDAKKLARYERRAARAFDRCIVVSENDRELMGRWYGARDAVAIPMGVDAEYFSPGEEPTGQPEIVFVGSMDMMANQDAILFFVSHILPRIRQDIDARFVVVGRNPPASIQRLSSIQGITVTGTVPDVRPHLRRAHLAVVPLRFGGGTRIKIFEAMAMGKAIVSTTIGAEGLPVTDGQDICLTDDADGFAAAVVSLLRDSEARRRLGASARVTSERYSWETAAVEFSRICLDVVVRRDLVSRDS